MNLRDYIVKEEDFNEKEEKVARKHNKTEYNYKLIYENDFDFIIQRTTTKTDKELVVLISQAQFYIKDNKENTIIKITSTQDFKEFFKHNCGQINRYNFEKLVWKNDLFDYYGKLQQSNLNLLIEYKDTIKIIANKKINPFANTGLIYKVNNNPNYFTNRKKAETIINYLGLNVGSYEFETFNTIVNNSNLDINVIKANETLIRELGLDTFRRFLLDYNFNDILDTYKCDLKRLLTYLLYTIKYRNGLEIGQYCGFTFSNYKDYLRMQNEMYGYVKEKYPLYWLSEKQMMNHKYTEWRKIQEKLGYSINQEELKTIEYEDNIFKVIIPLKNVDILDEAEQQQHCVASYIDRIKQGKTHIVFIREKLNEEVSCLTVEITPDMNIVQVRGFQNRTYTKVEYEFMKKWAKEKDLKLEVPDVQI